MDKKYKKIVLEILIFIWMIIIFILSNTDADNSTKESMGLTKNLVKSIDNLSVSIGISDDKLNEKDIIEKSKQMSTYVRKIAHFTEYFILCSLVILRCRCSTNDLKKIGIVSIIFCFIYACSDEFHQLFINGRAGQIRDVIIDTSGSITAFLIFLIVKNIFKNKLT